MDNLNLDHFTSASEHKQKIMNILSNRNLPDNYYLVNYTDNKLIHALRGLIIELMLHSEWFIFFGKELNEILKNNCNDFRVCVVNKILKELK
jgi:hypothetical protein